MGLCGAICFTLHHCDMATLLNGQMVIWLTI